MDEKNTEYINVPTYIEKAIKKLFKLEQQKRELAAQVKDYMKTHNIPEKTPLQLMKNIPHEEVDPNQVRFEI